eukprot:TRINITY_DN9831_c0_g1_i1.p1 TRINITY_DN9831_c0_g1~~TRINITY_DN9831_c0_g1_i1.p1  ORF type:complete len:828 (+),score=194.25 TRINITY_DN9831_c0_g1_i1:67-2550(+)
MASMVGLMGVTRPAPLTTHVLPASNLFTYRVLDDPDLLDAAWARNFEEIQTSTASMAEASAINTLQAKLSDSRGEVTAGLLYGILTTTEHQRYFNIIQFLCNADKDGYTVVRRLLQKLILEKFPRLLDSARVNLLWLVELLVANKITGADGICNSLLRHIIGGDLSTANVTHIQHMLALLAKHLDWIPDGLAASAVFTYLRVMQDHAKPVFESLVKAEADFCSKLLRQRFAACAVLGRELIRLLLQLARLPALIPIWNDLITQPEVFGPDVSIRALLATPPKKNILAQRLSPDAQNMLLFMLNHVKFGNHSRYQTWFAERYLNGPDADTLVADIIRYICVEFIPSAALVTSDILPRWTLIGWLLSVPRGPAADSMAKLALLWDWFWFTRDGATDIMVCEPALMLMVMSAPKYPHVSAGLIDYLSRVADTFDKNFSTEMYDNIATAMKAMQERGIPTGGDSLYTCSAFSESVRARARKMLFPHLPDAVVVAPSPSHKRPAEEVVISPDTKRAALEEMMETEAIDETISAPADTLQCLGSDLQTFIEEAGAGPASANAALEGLLHRYTNLDAKSATAIVEDLGKFLAGYAKSFDSSMMYGLLFTQAASHDILWTLLKVMADSDASTGWRLLAFLLQGAGAINVKPYERFLAMRGPRHPADLLADDVKACFAVDTDLFFRLQRSVYALLPRLATGNTALIHSAVEHADSANMAELVCAVAVREFRMFGSQDPAGILIESLQWETFEQMWLWHLAVAEFGKRSTEVESWLPQILRAIDPDVHTEVINGSLLLLPRMPDTKPLRDMVSGLGENFRQFPLAVLKQWDNDDMEQ